MGFEFARGVYEQREVRLQWRASPEGRWIDSPFAFDASQMSEDEKRLQAQVLMAVKSPEFPERRVVLVTTTTEWEQVDV